MDYAELERAHVALLNTLGASNHYWIKKVYKNAKAYYDKLKREEDGRTPHAPTPARSGPA